MVDNLHSYWASLADDVDRACRERPDRTFDAGLFEWCALGALRLHFTAFTGDVTSKRGAGQHGLDVAPERFHELLHTALTARAGGLVVPSAAEMSAAVALTRWVIDDVDDADRQR